MPPASSSHPIGFWGRRPAISQPAALSVSPMVAFDITSRLFSSSQLRSEAKPQPTAMTTSATPTANKAAAAIRDRDGVMRPSSPRRPPDG